MSAPRQGAGARHPGARRGPADADQRADRRFALALAVVLVIEVVLGALADAGAYPLWAWLVLAVATVLGAGIVFKVIHGNGD